MVDWGLVIVLALIGSAIGGLLRFVVSQGIAHWLGDKFPVGTMVVNVTGAFGAGFAWLYSWPGLLGLSGSDIRLLVLFGLLGGYTTVSSYALNSFLLLQDGKWGSATFNVLGTLMLCLLAVFFGAWVAGD